MDEDTRKFIEEQNEKLAQMIVTTMATKGDLENLATKADLAKLDARVGAIEKNMATKDDLRGISNQLGRMETQQLERIQSLESDVIDLKLELRRIKEHVGMAD